MSVCYCRSLFGNPTKASYWKKESGVNLPILRSLNLYDRSNGMDQTTSYELWGPLTNTWAGEAGISLHDLKRIGGLPTLRAMYEEFLPLNKDLADHNKYPAVVVELLCIHTEPCEFHKKQMVSEKEKIEAKKRSLVRISHRERMTNLNVIAEGELAAFLAFWLNRFVLPHENKLKSSLHSKKKEAEQVKTDLIEAGFSKLQDLKKEKDCLKNLNAL
ncbi:hypothetical protein Cgig2_016369 [Carnegiea gigantea]|uniref:Uncharacterized protein n=1 Tax=Carnegiea gigantea TaxID=171969 RepID=A0A9Q1JXH0_9CARY|nr:hypothetical protein Cgig2_016369 [Carnegiea gigantea]